MKDGGPAFPKPIGNNGAHDFQDREVSAEQVGMSLRDYFAAHAPTRPQDWFTPDMRPRPIPLYDHQHPTDICNAREYDCPPTNSEDLQTWTEEYRAQTWIQWPYAWADRQLLQREIKRVPAGSG